MPVYKEEGKNAWYCRCYLDSWDGKRKQVTKRGFKTKREAQAWENDRKASNSVNMNITLEQFVDIYFDDKKMRLKERTMHTKRSMIDAHIIPTLGKKKMNDISAADIVRWQNAVCEKGYAETYLRMIQNQLTALFTHASKIYGLADNPCKRVEKMGKSDADKMDFWTEDEYNKFISSIDKKDKYYVLFEILFWCGCRIGEVLALTKDDIDFKNNRISITKTYFRLKKKDVITTPKTEESIREIDTPAFLMEEIKEYIERLYCYPKNERLFPIIARTVQKDMNKRIKEIGIKKIRVHDLRHSHAAYLINQGVEPFMIKQRLGHKDIRTTLNTYGHLYPNKQKELAEMLNKKRKENNNN